MKTSHCFTYLFLHLLTMNNFTLSSSINEKTQLLQQQTSYQFIIKELDYKDETQIQETSNLYCDKDMQKVTIGTDPNSFFNYFTHCKSQSTSTRNENGRAIICQTAHIHPILCGLLVVREDIKTKTAHFETIVVHPDYRNRKVASSLMTHVEKNYIQPSTTKITTSVHTWNTAAITCYKKNGFYKPYFGNNYGTGFDMQKDLQPTTCCCFPFIPCL